jgi:glycosyltransferase involved in cell wall biosynthesis
VYAPNSIDYDTIPSELNRNYLLEHFPELHGKKIWLYLGRLGIFQKGLDILLQAYARARPATSKLVLIGPTKTAWHDTEEEIRQMAQALDIQDELLMPGAMFEPDKFHAFASADVLVYPSRWEATPLAVIEAATCGLTGILSKAASLDRMLTDADAAIEVELDPEKWANAIRTMDQKSKAELLEMGSRAARIVRENFRWDKTAAILLDAYEVQLSHARHHRAAPLPRLAF